MLKSTSSVVLGSSKSSTYPRRYASGCDSPAALLEGRFEHPRLVAGKTLDVKCEMGLSRFTSYVSRSLREFPDQVSQFRQDQLFHRQPDGVFGAGG